MGGGIRLGMLVTMAAIGLFLVHAADDSLSSAVGLALAGDPTGAVVQLDPEPTGLRLGEAQSAPPPAPPPGPAPTDLQAAMIESQLRAKNEAKEAELRTKVLLKPPGCRPSTQAELNSYGEFRTNCSNTGNYTPVSLNVTSVEVTLIDEAKQQFSVRLALRFGWSDPDLATEPVTALWQPQNHIDFLNVVQKRLLGSPAIDSVNVSLNIVQYYELTIQNSWDWKKYPYDTHRLSMVVAGSTLTRNLEPITVERKALQVQSSVDGFEMSDSTVKTALYGQAQGPNGAWGSAQNIEISIDAKRESWKPTVGSVVPIFLAPYVAYSGFFLSGEHLVARVTLGTVALLGLLIMYTPANFDGNGGTSVGFALDTWLSWFSFFQTVCIGLCILMHGTSAVLLNNDCADKSKNLDITFRVMLPVISAMTILATCAIAFWGSSDSILTCSLLFVAALLMIISTYLILQRQDKIRMAKSKDFPGI